MVPDFFGDASYCQYLLQFIVYSVWPMAKLSWGDLIALLAALFFLSTLTVFVLLRPAKRQWMRHQQKPARTMRSLGMPRPISRSTSARHASTEA